MQNIWQDKDIDCDKITLLFWGLQYLLVETRDEESRESDNEAAGHWWIDPTWIIMDTALRASGGVGVEGAESSPL